MNRFAELLDRLAYEPGRNNKLRLITAYFRKVEDPDRGYALAALTGALSFKHAKPGLIRDLIADRTDPVLFALSYDYVGDLSETVALMWPKARHTRTRPAPSPACGGGLGWGQAASAAPEKEPPPGSPSSARALPGDPTSPASGRGEELAHRPSHLHNNPPPPTLAEVVTTLAHAGQDRTAETARALARRTRRDRPLGAVEARHRRDADRHLGAARQDRRRRTRRQGCARDRADVARADAALPRSVRVAGGPRRQSRSISIRRRSAR